MSAATPYRPLTKKIIARWEQRLKAAQELKIDMRIEVDQLGDFAALLSHAKLAMPPLPSLVNAHPLVLFFETPEDREGLIRDFQDIKPGIQTVKL
jgi:hypothetical protein